ncbi:hypothetical protein AB6A40_004175 [Gnathostoma spinigerum]|uniref:Myb-like domain-containing protein n=1 Tax=Gnathostoma spinigerum TaxID=75299 RepID=A0ABD6ECS9_9BILA
MNKGGGEKTITLRLWVFKFVLNEFGVCLEGYRAKDFDACELKNWRSTSIVTRLSSRVLQTSSGTKYVLKGPIDQDTALLLGYPLPLIDLFKTGFPPDWKRILERHYYSFKHKSPFNSLHWLNSTVTDAKEVSAGDTRKTRKRSLDQRRRSSKIFEPLAQSRVISEKIDEENEADELSDKENSSSHKKPLAASLHANTSNASLLGPSSKKDIQCFSPARPVYEVPFNCDQKISSSDSSGCVQLLSWFFLFCVQDLGDSRLFPNFAIVLEGYRPDVGKVWKTSVITEVRDPRILCTASTVYKLIGPVNVIVAAERGYPKALLASFLNGFPPTWQNLLSSFFKACIEPLLVSERHLVIEELSDGKVSLDGRMLLPKTSSDANGTLEDRSRSNMENLSSLDGNYSSDDLGETYASVVRCYERDGSKVKNKKKKTAKMTHVRTSSRTSQRQSSKKRHKKAIPESQFEDNGQHRNNNAVVSSSDVTTVCVAKRRISGEDEIAVSRSGRVIKPPMATWANQRIVYNAYGEAIKAEGLITKSTTSSNTFNATGLANLLGLSPPKSPLQCETSRGQKVQNRSERRNSGNKKRIVNYSSSSSDEGYGDVPSSSTSCLESPTPIRVKGSKTWHVIDSSASSSENEEDEVEIRTRQRGKRAPKKRKPREKKSKKNRKKVHQPKKTVNENKQKTGVTEGESIPPGSEDPRTDRNSNQEQLEGPIVSFSDVESAHAYDDENRKVVAKADGRGRAAEQEKSHQTSVRKQTTPESSRIPEVPQRRRWTERDIKRLKLVLESIRIKGDDDWEKVAEKVHGRTAEDCKNVAKRKLQWKPDIECSKETEEKQLQQLAVAAVSSKGTRRFAVQAQKFARKFLTTGGDDDYFANSAVDMSNVTSMPSVAEFDPNDSLLDVLRSPVDDVPRPNHREYIPPSPESSDDGLSRPRNSLTQVFSVSSADKEKTTRYAHELMQKKGIFNASRMNYSLRSASSRLRGHNKKDFQLNLPIIHHEEEEESEDREEEDDYFNEDDD